MTADGVAVEMSGTSSVLLVGSDRPHTSPNLTYMYSVVPEQHLLLGCMSTTGGVLKWYRDTFCDRADPAIYKKLDAQILAQCPEPSPLIFLPYLAGERAPIWDTNAKGVLAGITCATTQAEIIRAAQDAWAAQAKTAAERLPYFCTSLIIAVGSYTTEEIRCCLPL